MFIKIPNNLPLSESSEKNLSCLFLFPQVCKLKSQTTQVGTYYKSLEKLYLIFFKYYGLTAKRRDLVRFHFTSTAQLFTFFRGKPHIVTCFAVFQFQGKSNDLPRPPREAQWKVNRITARGI